MHLYLLIGQSNMAGRGKVEQEDTIPHPRVFALNKDGQWMPAVEPIQFDKPAIVGLGPGLSFGKLIAESNESVRVGLIPSAFGQTSIRQWQKGETLYEAAVERTRIAMHDDELKAILWHQGETDTQREEDANLYGDRLVELIKDLRSDLGTPKVPFVVGELGRFLEFCAPVEDLDPNPKYVRACDEITVAS